MTTLTGIKYGQVDITESSSVWTINHGLLYYPVIEVLTYVSGTLTKVQPLSIRYPSVGVVEVYWSTPRIGRVLFASKTSGPTDYVAPAIQMLGGTWDTSAIGVTFSNGNLSADVGANKQVYSVNTATSGKYYWEVTFDGKGGTFGPIIGVAEPGKTYSQVGAACIWIGNSFGTHKIIDDQASSSYGVAFAIGDVVGMLLDMDANTLEFFHNDVSMGIASANMTGSMYHAYVASPGSSYPVQVTADFSATM